MEVIDDMERPMPLKEDFYHLRDKDMMCHAGPHEEAPDSVRRQKKPWESLGQSIY